MNLKFKVALGIIVVATLAFIVFAAAPPPGTYIVPSFFTTNAAKIYGTNGVTVYSNTTLGIYVIDGSGVSGSDQVWTNEGGTNIFPVDFPIWNNSVKRTVGYGYGVFSAGNPSDDDNTAIGFDALHVIAFGGDNTALGSRTLESLTNGNHNIAIGNYSLQDLVFGHANLAIGEGALNIYTNLGNGYNIAIGNSAGVSLKSGIQNVFIGHQTDGLERGVRDAVLVGFDAQGNSNDVVIGSQAGQNLGPGGHNVLIGKFADMGGSFNHSNSFGIGALSKITANNQGVFGKGVSNYVFRDVEMTFPAANALGALTNDSAGKLGWFSGFATGSTNGLGISWSLASNNTVLSASPTQVDFYGFTSMTQANGKVSIGTQGITNGLAPSWSFASNNTVLTASPTQVDFYGFTSITQANGKVSVGAQNISANVTNQGNINNAAGVTNWSNVMTKGAVENQSTVTNTGAINNAAGVTNFSNMMTKGAVENQSTVTNTGAMNTAGAVTNYSDEMTRGHLGIGAINSATNYLAPFKTRFFALTNATGGWGDWMAGTPMGTRRNWFQVVANGVSGGVSSLGCQGAASIGSVGGAEASTNEWPVFTYTTAASNLGSNGIIAATAATQLSMFPGKNNYFSFVGRISQMSTQRMWIGYTSATSATMGADSDTPTSSHIAMIRLSSAAAGNLTNWALVTCDGSACTATAAGPVSLTTTNVHVFEIMEDRPNTRWLAWVDGICIATNSANLPASGMHFCVIISTKEAVSKTFRGSVIYGEMDNRIDGNIVLAYP